MDMNTNPVPAFIAENQPTFIRGTLHAGGISLDGDTPPHLTVAVPSEQVIGRKLGSDVWLTFVSPESSMHLPMHALSRLADAVHDSEQAGECMFADKTPKWVVAARELFAALGTSTEDLPPAKWGPYKLSANGWYTLDAEALPPVPLAPEQAGRQDSIAAIMDKHDAEFLAELAEMEDHELRRRIIVLRDWHRAFASSLDGLNLPPGVNASMDRCRHPRDIRYIVEKLMEKQPPLAAREWDASIHKITGKLYARERTDHYPNSLYEMIRVREVTTPAQEPAQDGFRYFKDRDGYRWKMPVNRNSGFTWRRNDWHPVDKNIVWATSPQRMQEWGTIETTSDGTPLPKVPVGVPPLTGEFADFEYFGKGPLRSRATRGSDNTDLIIYASATTGNFWAAAGTGYRDDAHYAIRRDTALHAANFKEGGV